MTDVVALLVVACAGYFAVLEFDPSVWFRDRLAAWNSLVAESVRGPVPSWLAVVALPALLAGLLSVVFSSDVLNLVYDVLVLAATTAIPTFMREHRLLLKAVYANDAGLASQIANRWQRDGSELVDNRSLLASRMLELCATRLHEDLLGVLLWYMVLGPAGAVLFAAHQAFARSSGHAMGIFQPLHWVSASGSIVMFGVCGNMGPALAELQHFSVERAALGSAGIDAARLDLERVPAYGRMLVRTGVASVAAVAVAIFLFLV